MRIIGISVLAATLLLTLSGCEVVKESNGIVLDVELIEVETIIDPQTGQITKVTHWRYEDGLEVTTEDHFKKDTPVTDRRATSRAPLRIVD